VAFGRDWAHDAERRDFTINGLSVDADGVVHDHVGGLADLAARRVRFIGDPDQRIAEDYLEVRYEELVCEPRTVLRKLGEFLDHDMDFDRIQEASLGRLSESNSSFSNEENRSDPVNRWRSMRDNEVASIEELVGECLAELDYPLASPAGAGKWDLRNKIKRASYFGLLNAKLYLKTRTSVGRLADLQALELSESVEPTGAE